MRNPPGPGMPRALAVALLFASLALVASALGAKAPPAEVRVITPPVISRALPAPGDSAGPSPEVRAAIAWARAYGHRLAFPDSIPDGQLAFLDTLLAGKRVVQLGESVSGTAEFSTLKLRLIRYLHEWLDYDVIAIDGGLFDCWQAYRTGDTLSAKALLKRSVSGTWATKEALELFRYIQQTRRSTRPLVLAGFDVQVTGTAAADRASFFGATMATVDEAYADRTQEWMLAAAAEQRALRSPRERDLWMARERGRLVASYDSLADWLGRHTGDLMRANRDDPEIAKVAWRAAWCAARGLELWSPVGMTRTQQLERDEHMAGNLEYLMDLVYPGRRFIVWTHNAHISYAPERAVPPGLRGMGSWLAEGRRRQLYTVGLFMGAGSAATPERHEYAIAPPYPGSLEAILGGTGARALFVDLDGAHEALATAWMRRSLAAYSEGTRIESWVPADQYDAILFVADVHPPHWLE